MLSTAMLLDLGLRGAATTTPFPATKKYIDFPEFLKLYGVQCGLAVSEKPNRPRLLWVPTASGMWCEVKCNTIEYNTAHDLYSNKN